MAAVGAKLLHFTRVPIFPANVLSESQMKKIAISKPSKLVAAAAETLTRNLQSTNQGALAVPLTAPHKTGAHTTHRACMVRPRYLSRTSSSFMSALSTKKRSKRQYQSVSETSFCKRQRLTGDEFLVSGCLILLLSLKSRALLILEISGLRSSLALARARR